MAVKVVTLLQDGQTVITQATTQQAVLTINNTARTFTVNNVSLPAIEVVGPPVIANVVVQSTPPTNPFEGQIWIDIS